MILVFAPRSRTRILRRTVSRRRPAEIGVGGTLRVGGRKLSVREVARHVRRRDGGVEHVTQVFTRLAPVRCGRKASVPDNVLRMPLGDDLVVAEFLRFHVLVRVFDGDPDAWLAALLADGGDEGDVRFVRWIRSRLHQDPALMVSIRRMVDATPFWRAAQS